MLNYLNEPGKLSEGSGSRSVMPSGSPIEIIMISFSERITVRSMSPGSSGNP